MLPARSGRCQPTEELPHLAASELTADNRLLVLIDAVHLKDMLGGIQANSDNRHGAEGPSRSRTRRAQEVRQQPLKRLDG